MELIELNGLSLQNHYFAPAAFVVGQPPYPPDHIPLFL
jgi:hypothetical protein